MPKAKEACPNGLAPTTSTTMQLALGDALAVALLERRGLHGRDFRVFHPGGKLGAQLRLVRDIMHTGERLPIVALGATMQAAIAEIGPRASAASIVVNATARSPASSPTAICAATCGPTCRPCRSTRS